MSWFDEPDLVSGDQASARALGSSYTITSIIGRGSTGEVWRGTVKETGEPIAAKLLVGSLTRETEVVARFIRERAMLTRVAHPNVVSVRDLVVEGDTLAIVTDLVDGPSLREALDRNGTLRPKFAVELCEQILMGLDAVHQQGLIHRDLKPENVLIERSQDGEAVARIVDFGIAQLAHGESNNNSGDVVGSAEYIAPELLEGGNARPASDLYALGIVLYELVSGRTPFGSDLAVTVIRRQVSEPPGRPAGMPDGLWKVLTRLLAKDPSARPESAADAAALLAGARSAVASLPALPVAEEDDPVVIGEGNETIITTRRQKEPEPAAPPVEKVPRSRGSVLMVALVSLLVIALALGGLAIFRSDEAGATLTSATEFPVNAGSAAVHRTMTVDGDDLRVHLVITDAPSQAKNFIEYVPNRFRATGATVHGARHSEDKGRLTFVAGGDARTQAFDYQFRLRSPVDSDAFLASYERARVAALRADIAAEDPAVPEAPDAVIDASVAPVIRLQAHERAWLHVAGLTARNGELVTETDVKNHKWFADLKWTSSHPGVANIEPAISDSQNGRADDLHYLAVKGIAPGRARLTTEVAGKSVGFDVEVDPDPVDDGGGPRCEAGVAPETQLSMTMLGDNAVVAEGTVIARSGVYSIVRGGSLVAIDRSALCADPSVIKNLSSASWLNLTASVGLLVP